MKTLVNWLTLPLMLGLFLAWKEGGSAGAGNIFQVLFWFIYGIGSVALFAELGGAVNSGPLAKGVRLWYGRALTLTLLCLTAWHDHLGMATLVLLCMLMASAVRSKSQTA